MAGLTRPSILLRGLILSMAVVGNGAISGAAGWANSRGAVVHQATLRQANLPTLRTNVGLLEKVPEALLLVAAFGDEPEHGQEFLRLEIALGAAGFALARPLLAQASRALGKELKRRRDADAVLGRHLLFAQALAVEIGDLARPDDVELKNLEMLPDIGLDLRLREVDQVRLAAIRAAAQLPDHRQPLSLPGGAVEVVAQFQKTLQEPRLPVE